MSGYPKANKQRTFGMLPLDPQAELGRDAAIASRIRLYHCKACKQWWFRLPPWKLVAKHSTAVISHEAKRGTCVGVARVTRDPALVAAMRLGGETAARAILDARGSWHEG